MDLKLCSAIINGGGGGLGGATARRLVELGARVVIFDTSEEGALKVSRELGDKAKVIIGDQNNNEDVDSAISAARSLGVFSVLINAAGAKIAAPNTSSEDGVPHDMDTFNQMIENHLTGPFNMARLSAACFSKNQPDEDGQRGVIINTSSTAAYEGQMKQVAYSAAKAGVAGMTLAMARDLSIIGVRACAIAPGPIVTPRLERASEKLKQELVANVAFPKRLGHAWEYASLVEMILRTPFLNGQVIRLDGAISTPFTEMSAKTGSND